MSERIFLTGASGFLGSHIVIQLLHGGYRVRAAARGGKVASLKATYAEYADQFEAFSIADIASDQFPEALEGVDAVIHSAAPIAEKASSPEILLEGAVEGTLNVIRQAEKAGITRIVVTSSIASVLNPQNSFTDQDWNPLTKEEALDAGDFATYKFAKTLAEKELWSFVDAHPHVDVTTLNPPFFYGPLAQGFTLPTPNYYALSTALYVYRLLSPDGPYPSSESPFYVDVRDVAKAHVLALTSPPSTDPGIGRKRLIMSSLDVFDNGAVVDLIRQARPELKDRLTKVAPPSGLLVSMPYDVARLEQVISMKKEDFTPLRKTILDTVDSLLQLEKEWISKGYAIDIPRE